MINYWIMNNQQKVLLLSPEALYLTVGDYDKPLDNDENIEELCSIVDKWTHFGDRKSLITHLIKDFATKMTNGDYIFMARDDDTVVVARIDNPGYKGKLQYRSAKDSKPGSYGLYHFHSIKLLHSAVPISIFSEKSQELLEKKRMPFLTSEERGGLLRTEYDKWEAELKSRRYENDKSRKS